MLATLRNALRSAPAVNVRISPIGCIGEKRQLGFWLYFQDDDDHEFRFRNVESGTGVKLLGFQMIASNWVRLGTFHSPDEVIGTVFSSIKFNA